MHSCHPSSERSWELSTNKSPATTQPPFIFQALLKLCLLFDIRFGGLGRQHTVSSGPRCSTESQRVTNRVEAVWRWWEVGALCNHGVTVPERDKDVPSKHDPPRAFSSSNALQHRMFAFWSSSGKSGWASQCSFGCVCDVRGAGPLLVCGSRLSLSRGTLGL